MVPGSAGPSQWWTEANHDSSVVFLAGIAAELRGSDRPPQRSPHVCHTRTLRHLRAHLLHPARHRSHRSRRGNTNGDRFNPASVYYTVALFFAGPDRVFRSRVRWLFLGMGATICGGTTDFMIGLPWL